MKTIIIIAAVLLMAFILIILSRKRSRNKTMELLAGDKLREEALDKMILNESNTKGNEANPAIPFDVRYDAGHPNKRKKKKGSQVGAKVMLQITENNEISARKYMLDPSKKIYIGGRNGRNHIVVSNQGVDARQCEIIENRQSVYVHNIGSSGMLVLTRAGRKVYVEKKFIELKTGDLLSIGDTIFGIEVVKAKEK